MPRVSSRADPEASTMTSDAVRVLLLTPIMAPYRVPAFNALADRGDVNLQVIYLARSDPIRGWPGSEEEIRHPYGVLNDLARARRGEAYVHASWGLAARLRSFRPRVVIAGGWDQPAHAEAFAIRKALGYRFLWWVESTSRDRRRGGRITESVKRHLARAADGCIVPGHASKAYVRSLGVRVDAVFVAPNPVDHELFSTRARRDRSISGERVRFLFVGRLEDSKGVHVLLDAWERLEAEAELTVAGDGPLADLVEVRSRRAKHPIRIVGHLQRDALVDEYARADVFVFPSLSDPWGLVINEAAAAGLPVIATTAPGAVDDLVRDGLTGFVVEPGSASELTRAMSELARDRELRIRMGAASAQIVAGHSPASWAQAVADAVRAAADGPG